MKRKEAVHNITVLSLILLINLPYWLWHALVLASEGLIALFLLPSSIHQPVDQWQLLLNEHLMMGEPREKGTNKSLIRALSGSSHWLLSELCCAALLSQHLQEQSASAGAAGSWKSSTTCRIFSFNRRRTQTSFSFIENSLLSSS